MIPFMAAALVGGLALSAIGASTSASAASESARISRDIAGRQQDQERIRERSAELDARRRRRDLIRQGIIAKSQALAVTTSQGAQGGSGLQGAYGQIQSQTNWGLAGVDQNLALAKEMFASNREIYGLRQQDASTQSTAAMGAGLSSFGAKLAGSAGSLGNIFGGSSFGSPYEGYSESNKWN
jgi:hypothetical protein